MPRKDPIARYEYQNAWRKQAMKNGYGKWLWTKRRCKDLDSKDFREALEEIVRGSNLKDIPADIRVAEMRKVARKALRDSKKRWSGLGPPETHVEGGKTVFDAPEHDSLIEALAKLGLS